MQKKNKDNTKKEKMYATNNKAIGTVTEVSNDELQSVVAGYEGGSYICVTTDTPIDSKTADYFAKTDVIFGSEGSRIVEIQPEDKSDDLRLIIETLLTTGRYKY